MKIITSPLCILCMLLSQIIPLLTLTLLRTWYEESTPWVFEFLHKELVCLVQFDTGSTYKDLEVCLVHSFEIN